MIISTFSNRARLLPRRPLCSSCPQRQGTPLAPRPQRETRLTWQGRGEPHPRTLRAKPPPAPRLPAAGAARPRSPAWPGVVPATPAGLNGGKDSNTARCLGSLRCLCLALNLCTEGELLPSLLRARPDLSRTAAGCGQGQPQAGSARAALPSHRPARRLRGARCCGGAGSVLPAPGPGGQSRGRTGQTPRQGSAGAAPGRQLTRDVWGPR